MQNCAALPKTSLTVSAINSDGWSPMTDSVELRKKEREGERARFDSTAPGPSSPSQLISAPESLESLEVGMWEHWRCE